MAMPDQKLRLTDELIASCAGEAAIGTEGVFGLAPKGVRVSRDRSGNVVIDIFVTVNYGSGIPEIAWELQENVKQKVETLTNVRAAKINVNVRGVE